ncbi:MAG TPA: shikimate kinase [Gemmatimonadales bacterium]
MKRSLILVGLPGAGKTTVGRRVAEILSADFTDIDEEVEAETGRSIAAIFAEAGEAEFRRLERAAMDRALSQPPHLIAAGAGWIAQPGNLEAAAAAGARVLYLRIAPEVAVARVGRDRSRPLLAGGNRFARLRALLAERGEWYERADLVVDGEAAPEVVAQSVAASSEELAVPGDAGPG